MPAATYEIFSQLASAVVIRATLVSANLTTPLDRQTCQIVSFAASANAAGGRRSYGLARSGDEKNSEG